ncbi:MAG TPA: glycosyltransferase family 2 protein [Thermoanaerobaculaceae bacterium]|nr:glycosyltransferase family 2 protein [Thermoanaerobaculaceae bacterium]
MGRFAALIPVYNCEGRVGAVVEGVRRFVPDVLVIDDGSTDSSGRVARAAGARLVAHAENLGKGPAIRTGLAVLLGEDFSHVLMLDADGQHDPRDVPNFLGAAEDADLITGNRLWNREAIPARRFWTNFIGTRALQLMTGFPLEDSQCGFRLVAAPFLRRMGLVGNRYAVDTEIIVRAGKLGARFAHVPVRVIYDGAVSHYRPLRDTVHIVLSAARFKVDESDLRADPGAEAWRRRVAAPQVLDPLPEGSA